MIVAGIVTVSVLKKALAIPSRLPGSNRTLR
jgi:hypothetical protein